MSSASVSAYIANAVGPIWGALSKKRVEAVCVEPIGGPWRSNIAWGNRITKLMPLTANEVIDVTDSQELPGPPQQIGVTLFRNPDLTAIGSFNNVNDARNAELYAQITYGAGSVSNTFYMDWANGGTFSLQANTLRISALSYPPLLESDFLPYNPNNNLGQRTTAILAATLGQQGSSPPRAPTYTTQMKRLNHDTPTGQVAFLIPPFARRVWPVINPFDPAIPPFQGLLYTDYNISLQGQFRSWLSYTLSAEIVSEGIPIPGPTNLVSIQLTTLTPQNEATVACIFELGL